jgi:uncharacterized protein with HEPN domain
LTAFPILQIQNSAWKGAKGLLDIIAHQYFNVDAEEIFWVCEKHIPPLLDAIKNMIVSLQC